MKIFTDMLQTTAPTIPPDLLLRAYRAGIFPMADSRDDPEIYWVEPRLRAILPLDGFHCSRSLARTLRRGRFAVTCNAAFDAVIDSCAAPREGAEDSWISQRIRESYRALHALGHAHSIETWAIDETPDGPVRKLVGGLYGVGFSRVFCGESMFSRQSDASKVALAWLVAALRAAGVTLLDCQFSTPHLASLGAVEIPQVEYLALLEEAGRQPPVQASGQPVVSPPPSSTTGASSGAASSAALSAAGATDLPSGFAALLAAAAEAGLASSPGNFIAQSLTQTS